jgi:hypothetical protein
VLWIQGGVFIDEPYEEDDFPLEKFMWANPTRGFWGRGVSEIVRPIQREINYVMYKIHEHQKFANSMAFIPRGSKINTEQIQNKAFAMHEYSGNTPPVFTTVAAIAPEFYGFLKDLKEAAYEEAGVSQMAATAKTDPRIRAAVAMIEQQDIQTKRFKKIGKEFEKFINKIAVKATNAAYKLDKEKPGGYKINTVVGDKIKSIKWGDIGIQPDQFIVQTHVTGYIAKHPAGKQQAIQELLAVEPRLQQQALDLFEDPDIKKASDRINSGFHIAEKIAEMILLEEEDIPSPDPFMDLNTSIQVMRDELLMAQLREEKEEILEMFRAWITNAQDLVLMAQQPMMPEVGQLSAGPAAGAEAVPGLPGSLEQPPGPAQLPPGLNSVA